MNEKEDGFSATNPETVETLYFCALVFRGSIKEFDMLKDYLLKFTSAKITYQKISPEYLHVVRAPPKETIES